MSSRVKECVSKSMKANKSKDTSIELIFGKALWSNGFRFRKQSKDVLGKPDFTLKKYKLAILSLIHI